MAFLFLLAIIFIASIIPALVCFERWFNFEILSSYISPGQIIRIVGDFWLLPGIVVCIIALLVLVKPTPFLQLPEETVQQQRSEMPSYGLFSLFLISQLVLAFFISSISINPQFLPALGCFLVLGAWVSLAAKGTASPIYAIALFGFFVFGYPLNIARFSWIGDEYLFFECAARWIANEPGRTTWEILTDPVGIYNNQSSATCVIQGLFMRIFGAHNFGWRISNAFFLSWSIVLFDRFLRGFIGAQPRVITAIALASSHFLIDFGKIGYNNLHALFGLTLSLTTAASAIANPSFLTWSMVGCASAFLFYLFPAALAAVPLAPLLLFLYKPPAKQTLLLWICAIAFFIVCMSPLMTQLYTALEVKLVGTVAANDAEYLQGNSLAGHLWKNFWFSLWLPWRLQSESHFVASSAVDPMSGVFLIIGISYLCYSAWKTPDKFYAFVTISVLSLSCLLGMLHNYNSPKVTRVFMLMPFYALGVGAGFSLVHAILLRREGWTRKLFRYLFLPCALFGLVGVNFYQAYVVSEERHPIDFIPSALNVVSNLKVQNRFTSLVILSDANEPQLSGPFISLSAVYSEELAGLTIIPIVIEGHNSHLDQIQHYLNDENTAFLIPLATFERHREFIKKIDAPRHSEQVIDTPSRISLVLYAPR